MPFSIPDEVKASTGFRSAGRNALALRRLLAGCAPGGAAVFFFGSEARIVYELRDRVGTAFPLLRIAGICDADFVGGTTQAIAEHIARSKPDIIVLDMPARGFDAFVRDHGRRFEGIALINLPGAFRVQARSTPEGEFSPQVWSAWRGLLPPAVRRAVDPALQSARFSRIVLGQLLQGFPVRSRIAKVVTAARRGG